MGVGRAHGRESGREDIVVSGCICLHAKPLTPGAKIRQGSGGCTVRVDCLLMTG